METRAGRKTLVDRRRDPNFEQVTGHVPKPLARKFKVFCTEHQVTIAEGLEEAITLFLQSQDKVKASTGDKEKTDG
jgi:hypothetical protein